jgi:hypothetical protein
MGTGIVPLSQPNGTMAAVGLPPEQAPEATTRVSLLGIFSALLVTACGSTPKPRRVGATDPTMIYRYYGDPDGPQRDLVTDKAVAYCQQRFGTPARLRNIDQKNDGYYAVFECR